VLAAYRKSSLSVMARTRELRSNLKSSLQIRRLLGFANAVNLKTSRFVMGHINSSSFDENPIEKIIYIYTITHK
jgi:hypothetical protein